MENLFDNTASETIDLLEARLKRIEYAVCGHLDKSSIPSQQKTAVQRLSEIEHHLYQIASRSKVVQDLLMLHSRHPDLFQSISPNDIPSTLDTSTLLSIVLASAPSYASTASRLTSVNDTAIPPTQLSTKLINLQPRIAKIRTLQAVQSQEIASLRERSAVVIQRWYATDVLGAGELMADFEGRVGQVEQRVRRIALMKRVEAES